MDDANFRRAVTVLERRSAVGLPMIVLHAAMHRTGAANLTLAALEAGLRSRHDVFAVIDPPPLPWDVGLWPADAVTRYRGALNEMGYTAGPFVVLRPVARDPQGLVALLRTTVLALRDGGPGGPTAAARALLAANAVSASLRRVNRPHDGTTRPTTPLPDRRRPTRDRRRGPRRRHRRTPSA